MNAILNSLSRTLAMGALLLVALLALSGFVTGQWARGDFAWWTFATRWLHVMSAILWLGLLWYLNFVQIPTMPTIEPAEHRAAITKFIMPNLLFWFRHGALATVATGLLLAVLNRYAWDALTLRPGFFAIGAGMWLALLMAYNVWFVIWPMQQRALGLIEASPEERARAGRVAFLTSRVNTMLSIPMVFCMVAQQNGGL